MISQTSLVGSAWALALASLVPRTLERKRNGDDETGDESTFTRRAEGVLGTLCTELSNSR